MMHSSVLLDKDTSLFVDIHSLEDGIVRIVLQHYEDNGQGGIYMPKIGLSPHDACTSLSLAEWQTFKNHLPRFIKRFEDGLTKHGYWYFATLHEGNTESSWQAEINSGANGKWPVLIITKCALPMTTFLLNSLKKLNDIKFQQTIDSMAELLDGDPQDPSDSFFGY